MDSKKTRIAQAKASTAERRRTSKEQQEGLVVIKQLLASTVRNTRQRRGLSQVDLARRLGSSQSRVAKVEAGDPSVSLDLMVRAFLATGGSPSELGRLLVPKSTAASNT